MQILCSWPTDAPAKTAPPPAIKRHLLGDGSSLIKPRGSGCTALGALPQPQGEATPQGLRAHQPRARTLYIGLVKAQAHIHEVQGEAATAGAQALHPDSAISRV